MIEFSQRIRRLLAESVYRIIAERQLTFRDLEILETIGCNPLPFREVAGVLQRALIPPPSTSTISESITELARKHGLVEKRVYPADQRQPLISLTGDGARLLEAVAQARQAIYDQVARALAPTDNEAFLLAGIFARGIDRLKRS